LSGPARPSEVSRGCARHARSGAGLAGRPGCTPSQCNRSFDTPPNDHACRQCRCRRCAGGGVPAAPRWDYAVCARQEGHDDLRIHWIELHPAGSGNNVAEVEAKARWLLAWLKGKPLDAYQRRLVWVASGKAAYTSRDPKLKAAAQRGIEFAGGHLTL
jgi:hypothetical protein